MLYHSSIGIPENVQLPCGRLVLRYSRHALRAAEKDRYGNLRTGLPGDLLAHRAKLIEVETDDESGQLTKAVYRVNIARGIDLSLAVSPRHDRWFVRTVWGNLTSDNHATLNTRRYANPVYGRKLAG